MRAIALTLVLIATPALAQTPGFSYLPEPDMPTCTQRSVQEGIALGVPDGSPWWGCQNINGSVYLVIESAPRGPGYDFTANPVVPDFIKLGLPVPASAVIPGTQTGLSSIELTSLVPSVQLSASSGQSVIISQPSQAIP